MSFKTHFEQNIGTPPLIPLSIYQAIIGGAQIARQVFDGFQRQARFPSLMRLVVCVN